MIPHQQGKGFTFKQFHIVHEGCAMKVGTDAILLGAWAPVEGMTRVLDIGTGSGVISLMLAQRTLGLAKIDALDIDAEAIAQASANIDHSPWPDSVCCHHTPLQQFDGKAYDLLISNPPYFLHGQSFPSKARQQARHTQALTHWQLLSAAARLGHQGSLLALVVPVDAGEAIAQMGPEHGWYVSQRCHVFSTPKKPAIRQLLLLCRDASTAVKESRLTIHQADGGYSPEYIALCQDFYLKM